MYIAPSIVPIGRGDGKQVLPDDACDLWLDPGFQKADAICDLLKPFAPALMRRYEVSSRVNLVENDDPACADPVLRETAAGV